MGSRVAGDGDSDDRSWSFDDVPVDLTAAVPRCSHGQIILGCPDDDCPEQLAYLAVMHDRYDEWYRSTLPSSLPTTDDMTGT